MADIPILFDSSDIDFSRADITWDMLFLSIADPVVDPDFQQTYWSAALDRLSLYNLALVEGLGSRRLYSLTENQERRRVMDDVWDGTAINFCLSNGFWNFSIRSMQLDYSPSVTPAFGYRYAFDKPNDWVRTVGFGNDGYFIPFNVQQPDEASFWFSDSETIYIRYVSNDPAYGGDLSKWPANFSDYVARIFAARACTRITGSRANADDLMLEAKALLSKARTTDAMDEGSQPQIFRGHWQAARGNGGSHTRDGGNRSSLYG